MFWSRTAKCISGCNRLLELQLGAQLVVRLQLRLEAQLVERLELRLEAPPVVQLELRLELQPVVLALQYFFARPPGHYVR